MQADLIFKEALQLSPMDKAKLLDLLFDSFSAVNAEQSYVQSWAQHAEAVCDGIDKNLVPLYSIDQVLAELNQ